jgi:dihydrofolate reductase
MAPRTRYYTATSLDGFIADAENSLQWLFDVERGPDGAAEWEAFIGSVGALVMGATTYQWVLDHDRLLENPLRWKDYYGDRPCWVFAHRELEPVPGADLRFVSGDVAGLHPQMVEAAAGRDVWLVGGGDLVGQFHDAGLLEEILVSIAPVTLGAGAPLLPRRIEGLRLSGVSQSGQLVSLTYDVPRAGAGVPPG